MRPWLFVGAVYSGLLACAVARGQAVVLREIPGATDAMTVAAPVGETGRAYVAFRGGVIRVLDLATDTYLPTPFATHTVAIGAEGGLLGLAFDPNYAVNGHYYVYYTVSGARVVQRGTRSLATPDVADPAAEIRVLQVANTASIHIGGWIGFGPDGYLYIASGEGASNAQDMASVSGKILRVDVRGDDFPEDPLRNYAIPAGNPFVGVAGAAPEIWLVGLRNPFRCCFNWATGDLIVADVGAGLWEEVNVVPPSLGGANLGWPCFENTQARTCTNPPTNQVPPAAAYRHSMVLPPFNVTGNAIIGGFVYRGAAIPSLSGRYVFADYTAGWLVSAVMSPAGAEAVRNHTCDAAGPAASSIGVVHSFGEDGRGELYISRSGRLNRLEPNPADCNGNGVSNRCDIAAGTSLDVNQDGIPDECHCPADWDGDGVVAPADVGAFVASWLVGLRQSSRQGDFDNSGSTDPVDLAAFVQAWLAAVSGGC
ncbi:MAG: PQQ-dependent sugar dehydrogenase [Phycisphaeraceae bacterium]|nr:PQQ-dependent sugar dehydrogenase [Phycisphaeraceae bacterium]